MCVCVCLCINHFECVYVYVQAASLHMADTVTKMATLTLQRTVVNTRQDPCVSLVSQHPYILTNCP